LRPVDHWKFGASGGIGEEREAARARPGALNEEFVQQILAFSLG
jgi:hypothetical protein